MRVRVHGVSGVGVEGAAKPRDVVAAAAALQRRRLLRLAALVGAGRVSIQVRDPLVSKKTSVHGA
jgi:hypothetical protein